MGDSQSDHLQICYSFTSWSTVLMPHWQNHLIYFICTFFCFHCNFQVHSLCQTITQVTQILSAGGDCTHTQAVIKFIGYPAIYRICFGLVLFFAFFALLMIGVKSSKDPRSAVQNGLVSWCLLYCICLNKLDVALQVGYLTVALE